jgi:FixJ family two-component response regulator
LRIFDQIGPAHFKLIVTDIALPGANGFEVARELIGRNPDLRVLFISGLTGVQIYRHTESAALTDENFLMKPFDSYTILERVRALMQSTKPAVFRQKL